ncbi:putative Membrane-associated protein, partial [Diplonema papillatum]
MGWLLRAAAAGAILLGTLLFAVNSTIVMKLQPAAASRARSLPRKPAPKSGEEQPPPQLLLPSSPETEAPHAPVAVEPTAAGPPPPPRGGAFHEKYGTVPKTLTELSFDNASRPMTADVVHYLLKAALGHASKAGRRPWWGVSLPALPAAGPAACEKPPLERYQAGARMFHAHKKKRRGEHTPVEYAARMAALAADPAAGVAVAFIEGTQLPSSINEVPILDSKGGRYDVFSRWGDRKLWSDLRWIRRPHPNNTELQKRHTLP